MTETEFKNRTKQFALRVMKAVRALPNTRDGWNIGDQLMRSGTSVGANYRAACRARSTKEFVSKLGTAEEEADESCYWMELIIDGKLIPARRLRPLLAEGNELVAMLTASRKSARRGLKSK